MLIYVYYEFILYVYYELILYVYYELILYVYYEFILPHRCFKTASLVIFLQKQVGKDLKTYFI